MILLTSDWHLTDNPNEEYRWQIFDHLSTWIDAHPSIINLPTIYHLGDLTDRKDKHSSQLVNRIAKCFSALIEKGARIIILMGNHDKPINGPPFWSILDYLRPGQDIQSGVSFVTEPQAIGKLMLLPYSANPAEEWVDLNFEGTQAVFMHQTVTGVISNNGHSLEAPNMISFPKGLRVYSGDIHTPQVVKCGAANVHYVGAPHPVKFGDCYPCRMLEIDANNRYRLNQEIELPTIQKLMIRISYMDALKSIKVRKGDQVKIIWCLVISDIDKWPRIQDELVEWGKRKKVRIFSIEPEISSSANISTASENYAAIENSEAIENDPEAVLTLFADHEDLSEALHALGKSLLLEAKP